MEHLAPFQLLLTTCIINIQHLNDVTATSLSCPPNQFACADGSDCISIESKCNGKPGCADLTDELASECNNCAADNLIRCQKSDVDICLNVKYKCDGEKHCTDIADELVSECPNCVSNPSMFTCRARGQSVCLSKVEHQCDGNTDCDDGSDESTSVCDNCTRLGFSICRDGSRCVKTKHLCDGIVHCDDGSDESDIWSKCNFCTEKGSVRCPRFPDNCAKLCNGNATCPDAWDELLSVCKSQIDSENGQVPSSNAHMAICSEEAGLYSCKDGSRCLGERQLCDSYKDCEDGSDESAVACKGKCELKQAGGFPILSCDKESCINRVMSCSAQNHPLCKDGTDMADPHCNGKCYTRFPGIEDPYRWPCTNGTKRCILQLFLCDGDPDCDDATEVSFSSDEQNCPLVTRLDGWQSTLLLSLATVALCWILFFMLITCSSSIEKNQCLEDTILAPSIASPTLQTLPSFLLHPALSDMDNQNWEWQEVGKQLRLEVVFFNRDPQVLFSFLYHVEAQSAQPDNVHSAFKGFFSYLQSKGYDYIEVSLSMKETIGHHRLARMALKGPPNKVDRTLFQIGEWLRELEIRAKMYWFLVGSLRSWPRLSQIRSMLGFVLVNFLRAIVISLPPFLLILDYFKDLVLYLILSQAMQRLEGNCNHLSSLGMECLATSGTEQDLLTAFLVTVCVSIILTSLDSFFVRKRFFRTNFWLSCVLAIVSPLLPVIYHFQLSQMRPELEKEKIKFSNDLIRTNDKKIETLSNSTKQTKEIEVGLETVMQMLLLLGLTCFYPYVFNAPSGQSYHYFFGVALLVLKSNKELFFASLLVSFVSACNFYVSRTNTLRHESLGVSRMVFLLVRNLILLLVRVLAITSAIFIPVIAQWGIFGVHGVHASSVLDDTKFRLEFQKYFSTGLDAVTSDTRTNSQYFLLFLFVHLMLVASHAIFCSSKFGKGMMRERLVYLVTSFWLPLPFLTIRGVDRGTEKAEIWFLVVLHSVENVLIVSTSRLVYLQESYPLGIIIFDYVLVLLNLLGVIMTILYVYKVELYAGLSQQHCSLPSFSPEVSINMHCIQCFTQAQALIRTISGRPHWLSKYQSGGKHRGGQCKPRGTGGA